MVKKVLLGVAGLVVILLVVAAFQPSAWAVTRKATMKASPAAVFPLVNDFREWSKWSPWEKLDPAMKRDISGAASGVGASYHWTGNDDVGSGSMTILESKANEMVKIRLAFLEPWEAQSTTLFTFSPDDGGTAVTWTMSGDNNYMCKLMSMFMDMDRMIGADFEKGLAAMSDVATAANPAR